MCTVRVSAVLSAIDVCVVGVPPALVHIFSVCVVL